VGSLIERALAAFFLAWAVSFWGRTERLRERLGVYYVETAPGVVERDDAGGLGAWANCPMCAAVLTFPLAWLLAPVLAPLGLAVLAIRWFEAARPKPRWWE